MSVDDWMIIMVFVLGGGCLFGFFKTKSQGFGRFTTSALLIILVLVFSALMFAGGKLEGQVMANVLFAVFGFAGGLFTSKDSS